MPVGHCSPLRLTPSLAAEPGSPGSVDSFTPELADADLVVRVRRPCRASSGRRFAR